MQWLSYNEWTPSIAFSSPYSFFYYGLSPVAFFKQWVQYAAMDFKNKCLVFLQIPLNLFDTGSSSTASLVSCSDRRCSVGVQSSDASCSSQNNQCSYAFQYGDGSGTSGYYVSDLLYFDTILGGSLTSNSSAQIVFG